MIWRCQNQTLDLEHRGVIMGILNVTPDSFSDGGQFMAPSAATDHALQLIDEGAEIIDIGGESTRPGAASVSASEEMQRVLPVISALRDQAPDCLVSIDTSKADVAAAACSEGAQIINDVTGLEGDAQMADVAAEHQAGLIIMHMKGTPRTMQSDPQYPEGVVHEVGAYLQRQIEFAQSRGVQPEAIALDPGIGFGKTVEHNLELLRHLDQLAPVDRPLLMGVSRKSLFARLLGAESADDRLAATLTTTAWTRQHGARIHRVHDVFENHQALRMTEALLDVLGKRGEG